MDEDVKMRFEELDKRIQSAEERFSDIKWYIGGITGLFTVGFSVLVPVLGWNYNAEKTSLREFEKDIKTEMRKIEPPAEIELFGINREPLSNQEISCTFEKGEDGLIRLVINYIICNKGDSLSGTWTAKLYTCEPLELSGKSADEQKFNYEAVIAYETDQILGKFKANYVVKAVLKSGIPPTGKYPAMLKIYYGKGKVTDAKFTIVIPEKS